MKKTVSLADDFHVDRHDIRCRPHFNARWNIGDGVGAIERGRVPISHMAKQTKLVQIMQLFANPKRRNWPASRSCHSKCLIYFLSGFVANMPHAIRCVQFRNNR
jgi:hypothetical protein